MIVLDSNKINPIPNVENYSNNNILEYLQKVLYYIKYVFPFSEFKRTAFILRLFSVSVILRCYNV